MASRDDRSEQNESRFKTLMIFSLNEASEIETLLSELSVFGPSLSCLSPLKNWQHLIGNAK